MIPQEYIQEVVRRNDIEDIVGQYVQLRRRGRTLTGLCPFHNEKTPSFVVYPDTQSFYCFGCGAAGDVISFVRKYNNLGYVETVKQLASRAGMPLPEEDDKESRARQRLLEINRCAARYFYEQLNARTPEAALARRYWREKRGLSDAAIRRFGLGYAPEDFTGLLHYLRRLGFSEEELEHSGLVKRSAKGNLYDIFRHGAHHRCARGHHRLRRPCAGRLQTQVHQQPRDDGVQKVPHAVRSECSQKIAE